MANTNTTAFLGGGTARNQIAPLTLAAVTETAFKVNTDTTASGATAFLTIPSGTAILGTNTSFDPSGNSSLIGNQLGRISSLDNGAAPFVNSGTFDLSRPFQVRLVGSGSAAANAGNTLLLKLYQGTSATLASDTLMSGLSPLATASAARFNFMLSAYCFWDSTSQVLGGTYEIRYMYNGTSTIVGAAGFATSPTVTTPAGLSFLASVQWGNAVGGTVAITEFAIDQI